jgi:hypothetical protein
MYHMYIIVITVINVTLHHTSFKSKSQNSLIISDNYTLLCSGSNGIIRHTDSQSSFIEHQNTDGYKLIILPHKSFHIYICLYGNVQIVRNSKTERLGSNLVLVLK